jgi:hypothetical protein
MKKKDKYKFYFGSKDDEYCHTLEALIAEAKQNGEKEIEVYEAVPDHSQTDFFFCTSLEEVVDHEECKKSECEYYESKSGRGVCMYRRLCSTAGKKITVKIS